MLKKVLAFDFGASSGRSIVGEYRDGKLSLTETHRFSNDPVALNGTLYWDFLRLFFDIKTGIRKTLSEGHKIDSIGFDTWGVDFGLLGADGKLLENPVHYRDSRNDGMMEEAYKTIPAEKLYAKTGIQPMVFNTIFQLLSLKHSRPELLSRARTLLFMPDLMVYFLTGKKSTEYTIASTSGLLDPATGDWCQGLPEMLGLRSDIFTQLKTPGNTVGMLADDLCKELLTEPIAITSVCEHDTGSAIAAVPSEDDEFLYISCGTWSLMGTELKSPNTSVESLRSGFTNEGGYGKTTRFLKNIVGLWMMQESRRQWEREGNAMSFRDIDVHTAAAEPFKCFIDLTDDSFLPPGDMPGRIREFCKKTGQAVPDSVGAVSRCITESLAMEYRYTAEGLEKILGKTFGSIHIIGGGVKDSVLCQATANVTGKKVIAGPTEATSVGNIIAQLIALGEIKDIKEARRIVKKSFDVKEYYPESTDKWENQYQKYLTLKSN